MEADERFAQALQSWPEAKSGRLHVILKDARKVRWEEMLAELGGTTPAMMISNLPYNVGTPLLVAWLKSGPWRGEMALMFQKEVAERVCAKPNTDQYGRLAVLTHAVTDPHIAFTLPPGAFRPPPKVDSAVAVLHPLPPESGRCGVRTEAEDAASGPETACQASWAQSGGMAPKPRH